jgi:hypothetical protein
MRRDFPDRARGRPRPRSTPAWKAIEHDDEHEHDKEAAGFSRSCSWSSSSSVYQPGKAIEHDDDDEHDKESGGIFS